MLPVVQEIFGFPVPRKETLPHTGNTQPGSHLGEMRTEAEECESSPCVPEALKLFRAGAPCLSADLFVCLSVETLFWKELVQSGGEVGIQHHLHLVCGFFSS